MTRILHCPRRFAPLILLIPLLFTGCTARSLPAYDPAAFSCLLAVDSVSTGEERRFTASYVRENDRTTLTLTAPERLAGIRFTFTEVSFVMTVQNTDIPLSQNTAASLYTLTSLLSRTPEEAQTQRTEGENTVYVFPEGQLTVNAAGYPLLLESADRRAQVIPHTTAPNE